MNTNHQVEKQDSTVKAFDNYGSIYGFLLGAIAGVLLAGPNFQVWTLFESVITILGVGIIAGAIGHFALLMALGGAADGNTDEYAGSSTDEANSIDATGD
jgi:prolipoprotein diacylglyceryltransferase